MACWVHALDVVMTLGRRLSAADYGARYLGNAVLSAIAVALVLMLTTCEDFKKDFLCRPEGHCVNAPDGGHGIGP
jgi:hypothetical protein